MTKPGWNELLPVQLSYSDTYDTQRMVSAEMGGTDFAGTGRSVVEALQAMVDDMRAYNDRQGTDRLIENHMKWRTRRRFEPPYR